MSKTLRSLFFFVSLFFSGIAASNACHLASLVIVQGPVSIGDGKYQFIVEICGGSGSVAMSQSCGLGGIADTGNWGISVDGNGAVISNSGFTASVTSPHTGVVATGSVTGGVLNYNVPNGSLFIDVPTGSQPCDCCGPITQQCWNITFVTEGLPTSISALNIEGTNLPGALPCPLTVTPDTVIGYAHTESRYYDRKLSVYPNPANGSFVIELDYSSQVVIYSLRGEIVYSEALMNGKHSISIPSVPNGVYLLKARSDKGVSAVKITKN